jgi:hypothetical protein
MPARSNYSSSRHNLSAMYPGVKIHGYQYDNMPNSKTFVKKLHVIEYLVSF